MVVWETHIFIVARAMMAWVDHCVVDSMKSGYREGEVDGKFFNEVARQ
jgi:hypothetical protein